MHNVRILLINCVICCEWDNGRRDDASIVDAMVEVKEVSESSDFDEVRVDVASESEEVPEERGNN